MLFLGSIYCTCKSGLCFLQLAYAAAEDNRRCSDGVGIPVKETKVGFLRAVCVGLSLMFLKSDLPGRGKVSKHSGLQEISP